MSTLRDHARCVLVGLALGYVTAFICAGAVIGFKAGTWLVGPLHITTIEQPTP
ncbi:hypothetical protein J5J86_14095 [Aquabacter sp. L1I39]|uniref:hypothetical protein n=1 Tax=Aquabacter sp. L1I39 TaxID=2820278 RepID=UPI001ADC1789|nr:hypothetical protein [Aquabacter sp. L1I39]QTL01937.1 hypothetical protein J5J86_14095 [Aquabacter sp. L1I39]